MIEPEQCQSMAEVRAGVDALDEQIARLLAVRFRFMDAAARIKPSRDQVRDEKRKAAVLDHVRSVAAASGAPAERIVRLYDQLVESSIAYELEEFDAR
jgi:isochorismate pyruvate lyase